MSQHVSLFAHLEAGIPVRLLLDLACPNGPDSRAIYATEQRESASS